MLPDHSQQLTLFVQTTKDASFGVGAARKEWNGWKTKTASLGKYLTEADAALFGISMVGKDYGRERPSLKLVKNEPLTRRDRDGLPTSADWIANHAQLGAADYRRHEEKGRASRRGRWSRNRDMAFERQQL